MCFKMNAFASLHTKQELGTPVPVAYPLMGDPVYTYSLIHRCCGPKSLPAPSGGIPGIHDPITESP